MGRTQNSRGDEGYLNLPHHSPVRLGFISVEGILWVLCSLPSRCDRRPSAPSQDVGSSFALVPSATGVKMTTFQVRATAQPVERNASHTTPGDGRKFLSRAF